MALANIVVLFRLSGREPVVGSELTTVIEDASFRVPVSWYSVRCDISLALVTAFPDPQVP
jgi:hypothetical protein